MDTKTVAARPQPIWNGSGTYVATATTSSLDMLEDAGCFLESAASLILTLIDGFESEDGSLAVNPRQVTQSLYGIRHLVQLSAGLVHASQERTPGAERSMTTSLGAVAAAALELGPEGRQVVENFLRASRTAGLNTDTASLRATGDETLLGMWGLAEGRAAP